MVEPMTPGVLSCRSNKPSGRRIVRIGGDSRGEKPRRMVRAIMNRKRPVAGTRSFPWPSFQILVAAMMLTASAHAKTPSDLSCDLSEVGGSSLLRVQQMEERKATDGNLGLEPSTSETRDLPPPEVSIDIDQDLAVVPFRNIASKERAGLIYSKTQEFFRKKGFSVSPRPNVDQAIRKLGVLSTEAITIQDCSQLANDLKVRYLVSGTARLTKADTSFSPVGAIVSGARILIGGIQGAAAVAGLPFLIGGLTFSLVAGFSNTASAELDCRIYDAVKRKVIWVGSENAQRRKDFMAVFSSKKKLERQALDRGIEKLLSPVVPKLTAKAKKRRNTIVD